MTGDFNEDLDKNKGVLKVLCDKGFLIDNKRLEVFTCDKMRSSIQFQINKMRFPDQSTKDIIISTKPIEDSH